MCVGFSESAQQDIVKAVKEHHPDRLEMFMNILAETKLMMSALDMQNEPVVSPAKAFINYG